MLVPLASSSRPVTINNFWASVFVYYNRPHLVNRKLCGATTLYHYKVSYTGNNPLKDVLNFTSLTYETNKLGEATRENVSHLVEDLLQPYDKQLVIEEVPEDEVKTGKGLYIAIRLLLPTNPKSKNTVELVILDKESNKITFLAGSTQDRFLLVAPPFAYDFVLNTSGMLQLIVDIEDADTPSGEWLADKLFPKLLKWIDEADEYTNHVQSLNLVQIDKYCMLYKELKEKYGKKMVEIWPENTDPLKFVYEDVAIATYLICLWSITDKDTKPKFVDLGCGNGLLVYILTSEGFDGIGIDVRKRKIWDLYPATTKLEVRTIVPSDQALFPDATWIIGNHSDELTPWIPVIAARSSPQTNFFLLPCCCYNFDASKYIRKNPAMSQYSEYLQYIESICNACGFTTKIDRLRIPSTKRTCLVSFGRKTQDINKINEDLDALIGSPSSNTENLWINDYQAREAKERVRNCTQLDRGFVTGLINKLVGYLLHSNQDSNLLVKQNGDQWNAGGCLDILALVKQLEPAELQQLKSECGGLQTLMKNHRYIFEIAKGKVKLRLPYLRSETTKYISKPCWFVRNHPNGCLHENSICAYSHNP